MDAIPPCLFVDGAVTQVQEVVLTTEPQALLLTMQTTPPTALCPGCAQAATRVHSRYTRTVADMAWVLLPVRIHLQVRRFFCDTVACPRRIFTERLPSVVQPYARRTTRLAHIHQQIGLVLGGAAGSKLCGMLGISTGVDALLSLVRRRCLPAVPTPRVLGIDDWAQRKGHRYGTILVDHERGRIVDLLPDRTPESVRQWLHDHPGVEIVTRDPAEAYAQGIYVVPPDPIVAPTMRMSPSTPDLDTRPARAAVAKRG